VMALMPALLATHGTLSALAAPPDGALLTLRAPGTATILLDSVPQTLPTADHPYAWPVVPGDHEIKVRLGPKVILWSGYLHVRAGDRLDCDLTLERHGWQMACVDGPLDPAHPPPPAAPEQRSRVFQEGTGPFARWIDPTPTEAPPAPVAEVVLVLRSLDGTWADLVVDGKLIELRNQHEITLPLPAGPHVIKARAFLQVEPWSILHWTTGSEPRVVVDVAAGKPLVCASGCGAPP
jgi:hypothetical protein